MISRLSLLVIVVALAGCGTSRGERAASGAVIGAAAGTVVGAVTGLGPLAGLAIGTAAGGLTGAATRADEVDLGKPVWRRGDAQTASVDAAGPDILTVRSIQQSLGRLGYDPGPADGSVGPRTRAAIQRYQQDNGLAVDGQPSAALWDHLSRR